MRKSTLAPWRKFHPSILWARMLGSLNRARYQRAGSRPASGPFVSGDSFRALAHHRWDEKEAPSFEAREVKAYDIVFVSWHVHRFLVELAPEITQPFFLITSNSDYAVTETDLRDFRKTRGLHWWAANLVAPLDAQVTAIPLGLQNEALCWYGDVQDFLRLGARPAQKKLPLICWGFAVENAPAVRGPIREALRRNPHAIELVSSDPYVYRRELVKYQYVASPPGNGPDAHRTWEALALGVVPVMLETQLTRNFQAQGMFDGVRVLSSIEAFEQFDPNRPEDQP